MGAITQWGLVNRNVFGGYRRAATPEPARLSRAYNEWGSFWLPFPPAPYSCSPFGCAELDRLSMNCSPTPKWLNLTTMALCLLTAVSAAGMAIASVAIAEKPAWLVLGFEVVTIVACVLGVLFGRGRFNHAPGLALASIAGTIGVGAFLGWLSVQGRLQVKGSEFPIVLMPLLMGRAGVAVLIGLFAGYLVLRRNPRSRRYLLTSAITGISLLGVLGVLVMVRGTLARLAESLPGVLTAAGATIVGLLCVILISSCVHCLIRAFEMGRDEQMNEAGKAA